MVDRSSSVLISARTSRPSLRGRLRSSRMRSGRLAPAWSPCWRRKSIASTPSETECSRLRTLLSANASWMRRTSPGSSSTSRTSITWTFSGVLMDRSLLVLGRWGAALGGGQDEVEARAAPGLGRGEPDAAAVELDDLAAHGQADAGAIVGIARVQALEDHEDPVGVLVVDPDPVVGHREVPGPVR